MQAATLGSAEKRLHKQNGPSTAQFARPIVQSLAIKPQIVEIFLSHLDEPTLREIDAAAKTRLLEELTLAFQSINERHCSLGLDEAGFVQWLAERATVGTSIGIPANVEDLYLAFGCAQSNADAIALFDTDCIHQARPVLRRLGCSEPEIDDVLQDVREKLIVGSGSSAKIVQYQGTGPLRGWVRAVAGRQALADRRRRKPEETFEPDVLGATDDPHLRALKERYRERFRAAFRSAVAGLSKEDKALLAETVLKEMPVAELAARHAVHRVTASRWLARIRKELLVETRKALATSLDLETADMDSVIALVASQLDVSLYSVLMNDESTTS